MERQEVHYTHNLDMTLSALSKGGLLLASTKQSGESNVMTIGWGTLGIIWGKQIFVALVRPSRFTHEYIEDSGEFTVNVPTADMRKWVAYVGTHTGREVDKFAEFGMTVSPGTKIKSVTIDNCPLVYECRVVHKNEVIPTNLDPSIDSGSYPRGDYHTLYYGEILGVFSAT